jgi:putative DNA primase/helicase
VDSRRRAWPVLGARGKRLRVRRAGPAGAGGWLWNLKGVEQVLYRLPEVASAVESGEPVFVVEGEKDAEAVAALGICATTSSGGAGKWRDDYAEPLRGASVVAVPDNDHAGLAHATSALWSLRKKARELRLLHLPGLPAKGDVSDWIAERERAGLGREELRRELQRLGQQAPLFWGSISPTAAAPAAESRRLLESPPKRSAFSGSRTSRCAR